MFSPRATITYTEKLLARTEMTNEELWQATLAQLQFKISPANFATWLKSTYVLDKKEGRIIISVPNTFSKEWLENKYNKLILHILRDIESDVRDLVFTVERGAKQRPQAPVSPARVAVRHGVVPESQMELQELATNKDTNLNQRYTFDNFVVGPFNELAHAAALAIVKEPGTTYNPLFVYGGVGLGKTHLLQSIGNQILEDFHGTKQIRYISSEHFTSSVVFAIRNHTVDELRSLYRGIDVLIIDDIQFLAGKDKTQEELFHTFNALHGLGKQIVFSSDRPPRAIPALEERLRSRFEGGMIADISAPDYETRMAILAAKLQEKGIEIDRDVCEFVVANIQRNIRELEGAVNRLSAFFRLNQKAPTLGETRALLRSVVQASSRLATPKKIIQAVSDFYDIKEKEIVASSRKKEIVRPRQIAMFLLREDLKSSYPYIGKRFGGKDHTTAIYACEKIQKEMRESETLVDEITLIRQRIYSG